MSSCLLTWKGSIFSSPLCNQLSGRVCYSEPLCLLRCLDHTNAYDVKDPEPQPLTNVAASRLDDDGAPTPSLCLHLSHALLGLLVGIVGGTDSDFVLNAAKTIQLDVPITGKRSKIK